MVQVTPSGQLTDTEKLRKVITELIETERTYVKVILSPDLDLDLSLTILSAVNTFTLCCVLIKCVILQHLSYLMKTYLEPLKKETFLSNTEINALFGNIQEIYGFQQQFLQTLENALETEAQFYNLDAPGQFKVCSLK